MPEPADRATVEALVERHHPLAEQLTSLLLARVPRTVDRGDLRSAALFGLVQAAQAWQDDRGVSFEAFARHRIRGALLDELRNRDWASRRVRTFARRCAATADDLTGLLGRPPTDVEVADRLGVPVATVAASELDVHVATLHSTDALLEEVGGLVCGPEENPEQLLVSRERSGYLHDAVALLPDRLRAVIVGYYLEERPMRALAEDLSVTESRVSQMRAEAVRLLRGALTGVLEPERMADLAFADHVSERALGMVDALHAQTDYRDRLDLTLPA
jgi:RNA polymerase sigma factor for flagellar operon FliA